MTNWYNINNLLQAQRPNESIPISIYMAIYVPRFCGSSRHALSCQNILYNFMNNRVWISQIIFFITDFLTDIIGNVHKNVLSIPSS